MNKKFKNKLNLKNLKNESKRLFEPPFILG